MILVLGVVFGALAAVLSTCLLPLHNTRVLAAGRLLLLPLQSCQLRRHCTRHMSVMLQQRCKQQKESSTHAAQFRIQA